MSELVEPGRMTRLPRGVWDCLNAFKLTIQEHTGADLDMQSVVALVLVEWGALRAAEGLVFGRQAIPSALLNCASDLIDLDHLYVQLKDFYTLMVVDHGNV